jgi:hypothetical protein
MTPITLDAAVTAVQGIIQIAQQLKSFDKQKLRLHLSDLEDKIYGGTADEKKAAWHEYLEIIRAELAKAGEIPAVGSDEWVVVPYTIIKELTRLLLDRAGD